MPMVNETTAGLSTKEIQERGEQNSTLNLTNDYLFKRTFGYVRTGKYYKGVFKRFIFKRD